MKEARILPSSDGRATDSRLTAWEARHEPFYTLQAGGDGAESALVGTLRTRVETAHECGKPHAEPPTLLNEDE